MSQNYNMSYSNILIQRYSNVDILSTQGRIGRKRYFFYSIVIPVLIFCAIAALTSYLPFVSTVIFNSVIAIGIFTAMFMLIRLTIQRCHDFNKSGAFAIFAVIPFANIIFALIPGTNGLNSFGEVPFPTNWLFKTSFYALIAALVGLAVYAAMRFL